MKAAIPWAIGALVLLMTVCWIWAHDRGPNDSLGLLAEFNRLMDQGAAAGEPLDVTAHICGRISREQLEALRAEVGSHKVSYRPGVAGFWKSDKGDEWWVYSRRENLFWARKLAISINPETSNCSARVSLEAPFP